MNKVQFTKDLSASNRKNGEWLLAYYWRDSLLSKKPYYPTTRFENFLAYYDEKYPSFIEFMGEQLKSIESYKLIDSMKSLAKAGITNYPSPSKFSSKIAEYGVPSTIDALGNAASEIGKSVSGFFTTGFYTLVIVGAIAYGLAIYTKSGGKITLPKIK